MKFTTIADHLGDQLLFVINSVISYSSPKTEIVNIIMMY